MRITMMGQCKGDESEQRCLQGKFNSTAAKRKIKCNETITTVPIIKKKKRFFTDILTTSSSRSTASASFYDTEVEAV